MAAGRLDQAVSTLLPAVSRGQAARLIDAGRVLLNGRPARRSARVRVDDRVDVTLEDVPAPTLEPNAIPLTIIYRDDDLIVVDKPAGLVVHPAPGHENGTLANALLALDPDIRVGNAHRPGLVHRLDRDTSGLVVVARNDDALRSLQAQWSGREVEKRYLALVQGVPRPPEATIEGPIGRDPRDRKRMAVVIGGRAAATSYRVVEALDGRALLECRLHSGRTHQIRVHLKSIGHPLVGDAVYGSADPTLGRQFLHATGLRFRHPRDGTLLELESPLPSELAAFLDRERDAARRMRP